MPEREKEFVILWIEDQLPEVQEGVEELTRFLEDELHRKICIKKAKTVEEAERLLEATKKSPPDQIYLDIILPIDQEALTASRVDMSAGFFLWHRVRKQKEWGKPMAAVPIVVITARGNPEFRRAMEEDPLLKWLAKPTGPTLIKEATVSMMKHTAQPTGRATP